MFPKTAVKHLQTIQDIQSHPAFFFISQLHQDTAKIITEARRYHLDSNILKNKSCYKTL